MRCQLPDTSLQIFIERSQNQKDVSQLLYIVLKCPHTLVQCLWSFSQYSKDLAKVGWTPANQSQKGNVTHLYSHFVTIAKRVVTGQAWGAVEPRWRSAWTGRGPDVSCQSKWNMSSEDFQTKRSIGFQWAAPFPFPHCFHIHNYSLNISTVLH